MKRYFKSIISLLLILMLTFCTVIYANAETLPLFGDINTDGEVNIMDATEISKYLVDNAAFSEKQRSVADFNGDRIIDIKDSTDIQKMLASQDYKYAHESYETEYSDFLSDNLDPIKYTVDKNETALTFNPKLYVGELQGRLTTVFKTYDEYSRFFDERFDEYNEVFFEKNALIFVYRSYMNVSTKYTVDNVYVNDNVLYLEGTKWESSDLQEDMLAYWNQFIVVDKSSVKDIDKICIKESCKNYSLLP